jgi:hypothetical protein
MKGFLVILFFVLLGPFWVSCGGNELPIFTSIVFLDGPGGSCKALKPDSAYQIQISFVDFSGAPSADHSDLFNILAANSDNREPVGWFEGPTPTRHPNPFDMSPPGNVFTVVYRTPDDTTADTDIFFETLPAPVLSSQQALCTIVP